ncbi:MAG: tryptophan-rich sensory protein [Methanomicrobiaceae archaeon]|nr:tryptophan-rich sensory protein [Methanomicrobiaceae archaeon]
MKHGAWPVRDPVRLAVTVAASIAAGIPGSLVTKTGPGTWYGTLVKPWFFPPPFVFAPVWTVLYILMGIAAYRVWMEGTDKPAVRGALALFAVQLILNMLWSLIFFGLENPALALADILLLLLVLIATIVRFSAVRRDAAWLLVPYVLWVCFATVLNVSIVLLNPA